MAATSIEWATDTWNPVRARRTGDGKTGWHCEKISAGCAHCYAETFNGRRLPGGGTGLAYTKHSRVAVETYLDESVLRQPLSWRKPRRAFVCSMTDLFGEWVTDEQIDRVFAVMALARGHTFMVLTKRAARMREYLTARHQSASERMRAEVGESVNRSQQFAYYQAIDMTQKSDPSGCAHTDRFTAAWPPRNVWLGVSVEDQAAADERIPHLLQTPAAIRFLSVEPLIGPVELRFPSIIQQQGLPWPQCAALDWVIAGGESGPGARPMHPSWARSVRAQCSDAGVPFFFKQEGAWTARRPDTHHRVTRSRWSHKSVALFEDGSQYRANEPDSYGTRGMETLYLHGGKNGDPSEWPEDLRVRQYPPT